MMRKKYAIVFFVVLLGALISVGLFFQLNRHSPGATDRHSVENTFDNAPDSGDTVDFSKTIDVRHPFSNTDSEKLKSQQHLLNQSESPSEDDWVSAMLGAITRRPDMNGLSEEELFLILGNSNASQKDRFHAAWTLSKNGSEDSLGTLEMIFSDKDTPGYIKAIIAEGLGHSSVPRAREIILAALENEDDMVVRGAVRGLSAIGDGDAIFVLSHLMNLSGASEGVIAEAAAGLGRIDNPDAYLALFIAYQNAEGAGNESFKQDIISAMGYRDISETKEFFQKILNQKDADHSLRLAAVEALENAPGDTGPFLLNYLNDADSDIRAETAWALASAESPGDIANALLSRLAIEENAEVRKRLYQAIGNQESPDMDAAAVFVFKEEDLEARLAGYDLLAGGLADTENSGFPEQFQKKAIPELREIALSDANLNLKMSAVITLKRAGTSASLRALEEIAATGLDDRILKATGLAGKPQ